MKKHYYFYALLMICFACKPSNQKNDTKTSHEKLNSIMLTPTTSIEYSQASLDMDQEIIVKDQKVLFDFKVGQYQLSAQTPDAEIKNCANSDQGQHIHLILNNEPYMARYKSSFNENLDNGHYVMLAFLSRSYHESLKTQNAYVLRQFTVGDIKNKEINLKKPHLFYSRPKGTYVGKDTKRLLLDFYLLNTTIAPDSNKVVAQINGNEFIIDSWQAYFIEGLDYGTVTIELKLVDKAGKFIEGPFNHVTRTINLVESAIP